MTANYSSKSNRNKSKQLIKWLHLWPGLISALILILVCITGTMFVYSDEIVDWSAGEARYVDQVLPERLPAEALMGILKEKYPERRSPAYMVAYRDPHRSVRFNMYSKETGLHMVYMNPYTGDILKDDGTIYFFYIVAHLHSSLLLGSIGEWIIALATLIFLIELLTGLYLWWPRNWNRKSLKTALTVKWRAPAKRLTYDLHRVFGIYALFLILILALTGIVIAFKPLERATIGLFGGTSAHQWKPEKALKETGGELTTFPINTAVDMAFSSHPDKAEAQVNTWNLEGPYYQVRLSNRIGLKSAEDPAILFFDRTTGKVAEDIPKTVLKGEQVDNMIWVLHTGNWMGPLGKLLTFLGGLLGTTLPVTGFVIWRQKKKKK